MSSRKRKADRPVVEDDFTQPCKKVRTSTHLDDGPSASSIVPTLYYQQSRSPANDLFDIARMQEPAIVPLQSTYGQAPEQLGGLDHMDDNPAQLTYLDDPLFSQYDPPAPQFHTAAYYPGMANLNPYTLDESQGNLLASNSENLEDLYQPTQHSQAQMFPQMYDSSAVFGQATNDGGLFIQPGDAVTEDDDSDGKAIPTSGAHTDHEPLYPPLPLPTPSSSLLVGSVAHGAPHTQYHPEPHQTDQSHVQDLGMRGTSKAKELKKRKPRGKGHTKKVQGILRCLNPTNEKWEEAVIHDDHRGEFLEMSKPAHGNGYLHPDATGLGKYDETSFEEDQAFWGPDRNDRDDILFDFDPPWERVDNRSDGHPPLLRLHGKLVLDHDDYPMYDWPGLNLTLSTKTGGHRMEIVYRKLSKVYQKFGLNDIRGRMPRNRVVEQKGLTVSKPLSDFGKCVSMPMQRFRERAGLRSWNDHPAYGKAEAIRALQLRRGMRNNSTRACRDFSISDIKGIRSEKAKKVKKALVDSVAEDPPLEHRIDVPPTVSFSEEAVAPGPETLMLTHQRPRRYHGLLNPTSTKYCSGSTGSKEPEAISPEFRELSVPVMPLEPARKRKCDTRQRDTEISGESSHQPTAKRQKNAPSIQQNHMASRLDHRSNLIGTEQCPVLISAGDEEPQVSWNLLDPEMFQPQTHESDAGLFENNANQIPLTGPSLAMPELGFIHEPYLQDTMEQSLQDAIEDFSGQEQFIDTTVGPTMEQTSPLGLGSGENVHDDEIVSLFGDPYRNPFTSSTSDESQHYL